MIICRKEALQTKSRPQVLGLGFQIFLGDSPSQTTSSLFLGAQMAVPSFPIYQGAYWQVGPVAAVEACADLLSEGGGMGGGWGSMGRQPGHSRRPPPQASGFLHSNWTGWIHSSCAGASETSRDEGPQLEHHLNRTRSCSKVDSETIVAGAVWGGDFSMVMTDYSQPLAHSFC